MKTKYNTKSKFKQYTNIFLKETNESISLSLDINSHPLRIDEWYYTIEKHRLYLFQYKETLIDIPYYNSNNPDKEILLNNNEYYYCSKNTFHYWNHLTYVLSGIKTWKDIDALEDILTLEGKHFKYLTIKTNNPVQLNKPQAFTLIPLEAKYKQHLESL